MYGKGTPSILPWFLFLQKLYHVRFIRFQQVWLYLIVTDVSTHLVWNCLIMVCGVKRCACVSDWTRKRVRICHLKLQAKKWLRFPTILSRWIIILCMGHRLQGNSKFSRSGTNPWIRWTRWSVDPWLCPLFWIILDMHLSIVFIWTETESEVATDWHRKS